MRLVDGTEWNLFHFNSFSIKVWLCDHLVWDSQIIVTEQPKEEAKKIRLNYYSLSQSIDLVLQIFPQAFLKMDENFLWFSFSPQFFCDFFFTSFLNLATEFIWFYDPTIIHTKEERKIKKRNRRRRCKATILSIVSVDIIIINCVDGAKFKLQILQMDWMNTNVL